MCHSCSACWNERISAECELLSECLEETFQNHCNLGNVPVLKLEMAANITCNVRKQWPAVIDMLIFQSLLRYPAE